MQNKMIQKSSNKKADSNLIAGITFVLLSISAIALFWAFVSDKINLSPEISCSDFELKNNLKILNACYLNKNEVLISLERGLNSDEIVGLQFNFDGFGFLLKDKSFGCSDIRELNSEYGRPCEVLLSGMKKDYIFNISGEQLSKNIFVGVYLNNNDVLCKGSQKEISATC